jgi:hypothetical protein
MYLTGYKVYIRPSVIRPGRGHKYQPVEPAAVPHAGGGCQGQLSGDGARPVALRWWLPGVAEWRRSLAGGAAVAAARGG